MRLGALAPSLSLPTRSHALSAYLRSLLPPGSTPLAPSAHLLQSPFCPCVAVVLPFQCDFVSLKMTFYNRLLMTVLIPPLCSAVILSIATAVRLLTRPPPGTLEPPWRVYPMSPAVLSLHIWAFLLIYPSLSRQVFATFSCLRLRESYLIYDDPLLQCYVDEWLPWALLSIGGIILYSLGIPAAAYWLTRNYRASDHHQRVRLLLNSYVDHEWWFESFDLLRKLLLTCVVLVVAPQSAHSLAVAMAHVACVGAHGRPHACAVRQNRRARVIGEHTKIGARLIVTEPHRDLL